MQRNSPPTSNYKAKLIAKLKNKPPMSQQDLQAMLTIAGDMVKLMQENPGLTLNQITAKISEEIQKK